MYHQIRLVIFFRLRQTEINGPKMLFSIRLRQRYTAHILLMVAPIECDLGYRFRTLTLTLTLILKLTLTLTLILTLKVTIIYAVQNDTQIKFKIVL